MLKSTKPATYVKIPITGSPFVVMAEGIMPMPMSRDEECSSISVAQRNTNPLFDVNLLYKHYKSNFGDSGMIVLRFDKDDYAIAAMPIPKDLQ